MFHLWSDSSLFNSLLAALSLSAACAVLGVVVVLRRWTFAAEGIGHSGFGGAGTAWLLALLFPSLDNAWAPYIAVIIFCTLTALAIGKLTRVRRMSSDSAVGVFLVASLAWGFLAQQVYYQHRHAMPYGFDNLLFGQLGALSPQFALAAAAISFAVLVILALLAKEIIAYCFDPLSAQTSGIAADRIHDLLMVLLAVVIVLGARVAGSVLVVALLVLPGATALLLSRQLAAVVAISVSVALIGATSGVLICLYWTYIPVGPAIVLSLFVQFVIAMIAGRAVVRG